ncbi:MAG: hypothetical protein ACE14W_06775 [Candidatus Velamenicoccus archaeovorus]
MAHARSAAAGARARLAAVLAITVAVRAIRRSGRGTLGRAMATRGRALPAAGIGAGGVIVGHLLAYVLTFPVGAVRYRHLMEAGHGSFHAVVMVAGLLAGGAAAALLIRAVRAEGGPPVPSARLLATLQVSGFLLLELLERHGRIDLALTDPGVRLGIAVQVLVAVGLAVLLRAFVRVVRAVASLLRRRFRIRPASPPQPAVPARRPPAAALLAFAPRRAPPDPLPSC